MKPFILMLALLVAGTSVAQKNTSSLTLVKDGKSAYTICLPANPSPNESRAAEFFRDHLKKISGCELKLVKTDRPASKSAIIIAESAELSCRDGYEITTHGNTLVIRGGNHKGCIYGVVEILEKYLGVRHYSPGFVVMPSERTVTIPALNIAGSTPNDYRNVHGSFTNDPDYKDFNRIDEISDMFAEGYYVHTFNRLVPWETYFRTNPECFAWMNGKRIIDQLCLSNPEVLRLVIEKLEKEMKLQPDKIYWSVSQNDNFSYCQCEQCSKVIEEEKSPAGPVIRFVNQVAAHFPDKVISTLAYQFSRPAPMKTKPLGNVQVMLCTIELNRSKPIATDPTSVSFMKDIVDWGKISNHIYLWDYTVDFAHSISPFPNLHVLQPNIQLFVKNHVKEHFQQSNTGVGHEFSELKSYLLSRLLWNPDADVPAIISEFTDGFYGVAAPWIRKYIYHMQDEILKTGEWLDIYGPPTNHQGTFLSAGNIALYNGYFDEAEKAVSGDPTLLMHVKTARMPLQYAMMEIGKSDMFGPRGWYVEQDGDFVPRQSMISTLEDFHNTGLAVQSTPVNESGLSVEEYYQSTKRFIDVQVKGNLAFRKKVTADPMPAAKYSNGDSAYLTNGVRGANDYKVHWLGWEAKDFSLTLDLENPTLAKTIEISSLWDPKSWILHPVSVTCQVSADGITFEPAGSQTVTGDQRKEEVNRLFSFAAPGKAFRFVKFEVKGTIRLFDWHPSAGGDSWVFVDEIVVR